MLSKYMLYKYVGTKDCFLFLGKKNTKKQNKGKTIQIYTKPCKPYIFHGSLHTNPREKWESREECSQPCPTASEVMKDIHYLHIWGCMDSHQPDPRNDLSNPDDDITQIRLMSNRTDQKLWSSGQCVDDSSSPLRLPSFLGLFFFFSHS